MIATSPGTMQQVRDRSEFVPEARMNDPLLQRIVRDDRDVVHVRHQARTIATRLGFEPSDLIRIGLAVAEVAQRAVENAGGCRVEFRLESRPAPSLEIRVVDLGPIFNNPRTSVDRNFERAQLIMEAFRTEITPDAGLAVEMAIRLPDRSPEFSPEDAEYLAEEMARLAPPSPVDEILRQDHEYLRALDEIQARVMELRQTTHEMERAISLKTWFLSNISHELRTPLSSILGLTGLLLDRTDGYLSTEQERQVNFIVHAAHELTGMVNVLLDLARIETGREVVRPSQVQLADLFDNLRRTLRSFQTGRSQVALVFEDATGFPALVTDEAKLRRILGIFLSNALKFTERGEVRVQAERGSESSVILSISDTGIGIAPDHLDRIFEEFGQVDGPLQRQVRGPGLGLSLARKLAYLLGGSVEVWSEPGVGSSFSLTLPTEYPVETEETTVE